MMIPFALLCWIGAAWAWLVSRRPYPHAAEAAPWHLDEGDGADHGE